MDSRETFYLKVISEMIVDKDASILICCGGDIDKIIFELAGFKNVTISNLDERMVGNEFLPFKYEHEDIISLSFEDETFDYIIVRDGIHHTRSPHKSITEMYRVARKGVLCIESRDSFTLRLLCKFGLSIEYEHAAVYYNDCKYGGVNNTEIPNYVYRWTERDVKKTISSYAPYAKHRYAYRYGTAFPSIPDEEKKNGLKLLILNMMLPFYWVFIKFFRNQQNLFAFYIEKPTLPDMLFPWLKFNENQNIVFNKYWGDRTYKEDET